MFASSHQLEDTPDVFHATKGSDHVLETRDEPPPNYYNINTNVTDPIQLPSKLIETLSSFLKASIGAEHLTEGLKAALSQQSPTTQRQILGFANTLWEVCHEIYKPNEDSSSNYKQQDRSTEDTGDETINGQQRDNTTAVEVLQHCKDTFTEDQPSLRTVPAQVSSFGKSRGYTPTSLNDKKSSMTRNKNTNGAPAGRPMPYIVSDIQSPESSPNTSRLSSPETMTTPSRFQDALRGETPDQVEDCVYGLKYIVNQPVEEFIYDSRQQIRQFTSLDIPPATYQSILSSLEAMDDKYEPKWSTGSEWVFLLEQSHSDRQRGTIKYAITAMAFQKWHASQVRLLEDTLLPQTASQQVLDRLVGCKTEVGLAEKTSWTQKRKHINTHIARGKKWCRLVKELGLGILFKDAW
ncbi:hypothetical protein V8C37DRAFT_392446 [Trichoderma ceciliae]